MFFGDGGSEPAAPAARAAAGAPTGGADVRGHPGRDGPGCRRRGGARPAAAAGAGDRGRAARPPTAEATAEITLEEAYHGTTRLVEVDGKRLEVTIPRGADTGTRIRLTGKAPGGGDLFVVVRPAPDPIVHPRAAPTSSASCR